MELLAIAPDIEKIDGAQNGQHDRRGGNWRNENRHDWNGKLPQSATETTFRNAGDEHSEKGGGNEDRIKSHFEQGMGLSGSDYELGFLAEWHIRENFEAYIISLSQLGSITDE